MNCYVICYPDSKVPVGKNWADRPLSAEGVAQRLANNPAANVGLLLGPVSGLIDVECDGEEATAAYDRLLGNVLAPSWASKRGKHHLYKYDERLADLPNAVHYEGVEFRLGNGKATHSLCPPSEADGFRREWLVRLDQCPAPRLPEEIIQALLTLPPATKRAKKPAADIPETRNAKVNRLLSYCDRVDLPVVEVRERPRRARIYRSRPLPVQGAGSRRRRQSGDHRVSGRRSQFQVFPCEVS